MLNLEFILPKHVRKLTKKRRKKTGFGTRGERAHRKIRHAKKRHHEAQEAKEGPQYEAGAF